MMPTTLGPYRIVRRLGEGGMGVVYEAINDTIDRRVAIKVLHPEYAKNAEVTARFFNEARAVNRIEHPGLVQISDYAQLPDGTAYIVMEFLKGETLSSRLQRGPIAVGPALIVVWQVADALSAAHAKGIIHRDLKPDNVMLVGDSVAPDGERAKLLDFGIAKLAEAAKTGQVKTRTDMIMGTPKYMAPEQCRGAREVDDKADVYALGVVLYQMLAGRTPFDGEGHGEILAMHIYEAPPPLQTLVPNLPPEVTALVHRLLTKDKAQRPSMREVFEQLSSLAATYGQLSMGGASSRPSGAIATGPLTPGLPLNNSTLGHSTGQRVASGRFGPQWRAYTIGVCALLLLGGGVAWQVSRSSAQPSVSASASSSGKQSPAVVQQPPIQRTVTWVIRSEPSGAEIVRVRDGTILGKTPWESRQAFAPGTEDLKLRLAGYVERDITIARSGHNEMTEHLEPAVSPSQAEQKPTVPPEEIKRKPGSKTKAPTLRGHNHGPVQPED